MIAGESVREQVLAIARAASGAAHPGMAAAAWLTVMVPLWFGGLGLLLFPRLPAPAVVGWLVVTAFLFVPAVTFLPGKTVDLTELVTGPGAGGFATGLRWTAPAVGLFPAMFVADGTRWATRRVGVTAVLAVSVATLALALARAS